MDGYGRISAVTMEASCFFSLLMILPSDGSEWCLKKKLAACKFFKAKTKYKFLMHTIK
jgi:hypothetical protein